METRSERQTKMRLATLRRRLKKIKNEFTRVQKKHRENVFSSPKRRLPEELCFQTNCPCRTENRIVTMERQLNAAECAIQNLERIFDSDADDNIDDDEPVLDIQNLPMEIVMEIFKYLTLDDLCRAGRVCKSWYQMTRSQVFWKKVQANIAECSSSIPEVTLQFIKMLPSSIISININFDNTENWYINFNEFSKRLSENCPNLQTLILNHVRFEVDTDELMELCIGLPKDIRVLVLPHCKFNMKQFSFDPEEFISNIEVLDVSEWNWTIFSRFSCNHMPNLKKLRLTGCEFFYDEFFEPLGSFLDQLEILDLERTLASRETFRTIVSHSQHLTELYLCSTLIKDNALIFINEHNGLTCLKVICLRGCDVTTVGVYSLVRSCPSLEKIFVGRDERNPYISKIGYIRWKSEKIEDLGFGYCNHSKTVDYNEL